MPAEATYCVRSKSGIHFVSHRTAAEVLRLGSVMAAVRACNDSARSWIWWATRSIPESVAPVARLTAADAGKVVAIFAGEHGWNDLVVVPEAEWEEWPADE